MFENQGILSSKSTIAFERQGKEGKIRETEKERKKERKERKKERRKK